MMQKDDCKEPTSPDFISGGFPSNTYLDKRDAHIWTYDQLIKDDEV